MTGSFDAVQLFSRVPAESYFHRMLCMHFSERLLQETGAQEGSRRDWNEAWTTVGGMEPNRNAGEQKKLAFASRSPTRHLRENSANNANNTNAVHLMQMWQIYKGVCIQTDDTNANFSSILLQNLYLHTGVISLDVKPGLIRHPGKKIITPVYGFTS